MKLNKYRLKALKRKTLIWLFFLPGSIFLTTAFTNCNTPFQAIEPAEKESDQSSTADSDVTAPPASPSLGEPPPSTDSVQPGVPQNSFLGEYFNSKDLTSSVVTRIDTRIDFDWGAGAPAAGVNSNNFSVRWTGDIHFAAGNQRFTITSDDGFRLYVGNRLVLDQFVDQPSTTSSVDVNLTAGFHRVVLEYFDSGGNALAKLSYTGAVAATPDPAPTSDLETAQAFMKGLTFGINVERGRAWYLSDFGSGTSAYSYFKSMGITHVRLFYPFIGQMCGPGCQLGRPPKETHRFCLVNLDLAGAMEPTSIHGWPRSITLQSI